jgi:DNA-binding response OmpR family regulator
MVHPGTLASVKDIVRDTRLLGRDDPQLVILVADDDEDDFLLVKAVFETSTLPVDLRWVEDGQQAMDYLLHTDKYVAYETSPRPDLILLDLIMPRKDGLETLKEIKGHPYVSDIPVIVLTSSTSTDHMLSGLELGADSFFVKPSDLDERIAMLDFLCEYYFETLVWAKEHRPLFSFPEPVSPFQHAF